MITRERTEICVVILGWSLIPMLSAVWNGNLAGSPYTDLYPSVWSLWATESWWGTWHNGWFNHPQGQAWSPNTLLWGTAIIPFKDLVPIESLYNFCLFMNRLLTCWAFYLVGRSWNNSHHNGLMWMVIIGMNPMVHGFAVEGIIEGTQLWPLGFWLWSIKKQRWTHSVFFGTLVIISNWYWAICWGVLSIILGVDERKVWCSLCLSIGLSMPWIVHFVNILEPSTQLDAHLYQAMGLSLTIPTPNILTTSNPFAMSNYTGWTVCSWLLWTLWQRTNSIGWGILGLGLILSMGFPFLQDLPIIGSMRFPYRMHLLTLVGACIVLTNKRHSWSHYWLVLIPLEYLLLSPIDWQIPSASSKAPSYVDVIDGVVLELPGPLQRAPGDIDPSRPRSKYLQYYQTLHQQPSPWTLEFNGLVAPNDCFKGTRRIDPHATQSERAQSLKKECWNDIEWVVIHNTSPRLNEWLHTLNFVQETDTLPILWHRPAKPLNDSQIIQQ